MRVVFDDVSVDLGGTRVLHNIDLQIESGHFIGLVGPNGSGKSTLLRTLYRAITPSSGAVLLDGVDAWKTPRREVARSVAVMTQETSSEFDLSVLDVVLLARVPYQRGFGRDSDTDVERAEAALADVGAADLANRPIGHLSGGQRQRVQMARVLASDSQVVVLDEPTNHLDVAFQLELMRIASSLGRTVIAALHDLNLAAAHCDRIAVLQHGRLITVGEPAHVLDRALIRSVFAVDTERLVHPRTRSPIFAFDHLEPVHRSHPN